jgi:hypothetical protein
MASGIHCDGAACEKWEKASTADDSGFMTVFGGVYAISPSFVLHFCSWDCLINYAAFSKELS